MVLDYLKLPKVMRMDFQEEETIERQSNYIDKQEHMMMVKIIKLTTMLLIDLAYYIIKG